MLFEIDYVGEIVVPLEMADAGEGKSCMAASLLSIHTMLLRIAKSGL